MAAAKRKTTTKKKAPAKGKATRNRRPTRQAAAIRSAEKKNAARKAATAKANKIRKEAGVSQTDTHLNDDAIELCAQLIGQRLLKTDIRRVMEEAIGEPYNMAKFQVLIKMAKTRIRLHVQRERGDTKSQAIEFYESVIRTKPFSLEAIRAQERIDAILGHDAKYNDGTDQTTEHIVDRYRRALSKARESVPDAPE